MKLVIESADNVTTYYGVADFDALAADADADYHLYPEAENIDSEKVAGEIAGAVDSSNLPDTVSLPTENPTVIDWRSKAN